MFRRFRTLMPSCMSPHMANSSEVPIFECLLSSFFLATILLAKLQDVFHSSLSDRNYLHHTGIMLASSRGVKPVTTCSAGVRMSFEAWRRLPEPVLVSFERCL